MKDSLVNRARVEQIDATWKTLLAEILQEGFHGTANLELTISDGTIQRICRTVERIEKLMR